MATKSTLVSMAVTIGANSSAGFTFTSGIGMGAATAPLLPCVATRSCIWSMVSLQRRCVFTRAMSSCLSNGLWIQSLQPSSSPLTTELAWFLAETMMMGSCSVVVFLRCSCNTSKPLIPGIIRSKRIKSGMMASSFSMYSRHSVPLMQMTMENPQGSNTDRITSWFTWSSSTDMMTLDDCLTGGMNGSTGGACGSPCAGTVAAATSWAGAFWAALAGFA
mmetsp:Transcript_50984/g.118469  ORF Transcript_50984/g.118469 Transcript_50984/m.118469 type:complete len:219 (+) Transcript_50984:1207-1863(+)